MSKMPELPFDRIYEIMREHPLSFSECAQRGLLVAKAQRELFEGKWVELPSMKEIITGLAKQDRFISIEDAYKIWQWLKEER